MKKLLIMWCALGVLCTVPALAKPMYVTASRNYVSRDIKGLAPFSALLVSGQAEIVFRQGAEGTYEVNLYGSDNLVDMVEVSSEGGVLSVRYKEPLMMSGSAHLKVNVAAPSLERVEIRDEAEVKVPGELSVKDLTVVASGKAEADFASVSAAAVKADVRSAAEVEFGTLACQKLTAEAMEKGNFESDRTDCPAVEIKASGRAGVSVSGLAGRSVNAVSDGYAEIKLSGRAQEVSLTARGKSALDAGSLRSSMVNASSDGSARLKVRAEETLNAQAQNRGVVEYKGLPKTLNRSGKAGNIRQDK